ncbi:hypothetical protein [Aliiroseovarius marinus]|uniref:hypothetical protein n=1 Tax=Aliiroseovarius marinus TaxID=2500159 RepID=UPI0024956371|nr:hypothetical protein [Aliiroseovarius marinus]
MDADIFGEGSPVREAGLFLVVTDLLMALDLDDYSVFVDSTLRRLPGVTSIRSNLSLRKMKSSNKLPVEYRQN